MKKIIQSAQVNQPHQLAETSSNSIMQPMMDYNENSTMQAHINEDGIVILRKIVQHLAPNITSTFSIGDFGCSHGGNSMISINAILDAMQETRRNDGPLSIQVYHNDLPINDFREVFKCLNDPELTYQNHEITKANPGNRIFSMMSGKSFYSQCFPNALLDLSFSFNSIHWMPDIGVTLYRPLMVYSKHVSEEQLSLIQDVAQKQFVTFLSCRAKELRKGGKLVISLLGDFGNLGGIDDIWQQHINEYNIDPSLLGYTLIPLIARTKENVVQAIHEVPSLELIHYIDNMFENVRGRNSDHLKAIFWPQLYTGLVKGAVFDDEAKLTKFLDEFFSKLSTLYTASENVAATIRYVAIEKVAD
ncbi:S-adenosyl-L-methionine-dependent methyltransferase [Basidiobolus meristosporus CBS 931.73]|uniref:S-adenosyl-L-methionine-dependent methyltransferase n=1 Tax=Basidiobolus meristosporus CBS 931.73 TaxID=1314790 RepID=A0A1Y1Y2X2_9FUNG|nr:S-adenosyl-L-methionine-dependent methyltransferase [Basidiobolus meristosporus CBS 931.73]|eukprot:ORX92367.1 S-adenosyl-L-methionine-dependent methyltransferase [Basidiobolus meristosporus CBS 931.73]